MFGQTLKQWFWDMYDHLGRLIAINVLVAGIAISAVYFLGGALFVFAIGLGQAPGMLVLCAGTSFLGFLVSLVWLPGLLHFGSLVAAEKDPPFRLWLRGFRVCLPRLLPLLAFYWTLAGVTAFNIWFWFTKAPGTFGGGGAALAAYLVGGLGVWLQLLLFGVMLHALPIVARGERLFPGTKRAVLNLFRYPILTLMAALFIVSFLVICTILKLVGLVTFGFSGAVMFVNSLHDVILEADEACQRSRANNTAPPPSSWRDILEAQSLSEEARLRRARYDRTLADVLKPWED